MKYIILAAGKGTRLHPLTLMNSKSMYKLDSNTTVLGRMISLIKKYDTDADIVVVTGYHHLHIECCVKDVTYIYNPFYEITNSIASLWFAKNHLVADNITIINGDIVVDKQIVSNVISQSVRKPYVLLDSSIKESGDYNVQVSGKKVLVMSKNLENYFGEYAGVTRLNRESGELLKKEINSMVEHGFYDQWYENALVQLIFKNDFELYYEDIANYEWTEVDSVNDLLLAKKIHMSEKYLCEV